MNSDRTSNELGPSPSLSVAAVLILLLLILFTRSARRKAVGGIRLAAPAFVPLAPDAVSQAASELGAAVGELLDAERHRSEG
jgi:hypothetical protein